MEEFSSPMLKYEMDEKAVRQQVTERGKREKKRKFSPQSLAIKIIKSSKVTKKERRAYILKIWNMIRPKAEREKEREEKLFSPIVKIRKDEKKEKERIRQSVKKKGDERKVKWEKKKKEWKKRRKNSELNCLFFSMVFLFISLSSLKRGGVTWWLTDTRRWEWYSLPVELKLSSSQKVTVRNDCGSHRCLHLSDLGVAGHRKGKEKMKPNDWWGDPKRKWSSLPLNGRKYKKKTVFGQVSWQTDDSHFTPG